MSLRLNFFPVTLAAALFAPSAALASHAVTLVNLSQTDPSTGGTVASGGCVGGTTVGVQVSSDSPTCGGADYYVQVEVVRRAPNQRDGHVAHARPLALQPQQHLIAHMAVHRLPRGLQCSHRVRGQLDVARGEEQQRLLRPQVAPFRSAVPVARLPGAPGPEWTVRTAPGGATSRGATSGASAQGSRWSANAAAETTRVPPQNP